MGDLNRRKIDVNEKILINLIKSLDILLKSSYFLKK